MELERLRGKMPLVAFVLLAAVCLLIIGLACACLSDHPAKAADRAASLGAELPAVIEMWSPAAVAGPFVLLALLVLLATRPTGRASPALLQRFLF